MVNFTLIPSLSDVTKAYSRSEAEKGQKKIIEKEKKGNASIDDFHQIVIKKN